MRLRWPDVLVFSTNIRLSYARTLKPPAPLGQKNISRSHDRALALRNIGTRGGVVALNWLSQPSSAFLFFFFPSTLSPVVVLSACNDGKRLIMI